jgi:hypothetical protein
MSQRQFSQSKVHDLLGALLGVFALVMLITAAWQVDTTGPDPFYKGPLIFPLIVFVLMIIGSLPSLWRLITPSGSATWYLDGYGAPKKGMLVLGLLVAFLSGVLTIGMEISAWMFLVISMKIVGQDSPRKLVVFPAAVTAILYVVFKLCLDIWFPEPVIMALFAE